MLAAGPGAGHRRQRYRPRTTPSSRSAWPTCRSAARTSSACPRPSSRRPANYANVEVVVTNADGDVEKLTSDIEDLIAQKRRWHRPERCLHQRGAGGPGRHHRRPASRWSWSTASSRVATTPAGSARTTTPSASRTASSSSTSSAAPGKLGVIKGGPADNTIGSDRTDGMLSKVAGQRHRGHRPIPTSRAGAPTAAFTAAETLLAQNPDLNAIFCENDSMCLGAQKVIEDQGLTGKVFVVGVDGAEGSPRRDHEGRHLQATGLNNSDQIGRAGFNRLMAILAGASGGEGHGPAVTAHHHRQRPALLQPGQRLLGHVLLVAGVITDAGRFVVPATLPRPADRASGHASVGARPGAGRSGPRPGAGRGPVARRPWSTLDLDEPTRSRSWPVWPGSLRPCPASRGPPSAAVAPRPGTGRRGRGRTRRGALRPAVSGSAVADAGQPPPRSGAAIRAAPALTRCDWPRTGDRPSASPRSATVRVPVPATVYNVISWRNPRPWSLNCAANPVMRSRQIARSTRIRSPGNPAAAQLIAGRLDDRVEQAL